MRSIKVIHFGMSDEIKKSIMDMIDQLEKYNWAICNDGNAIRFFSRFTPDNYKRNRVLRFYRSDSDKESFVWLDTKYEIKKYPNYNFLIKPKGTKDKKIDNAFYPEEL